MLTLTQVKTLLLHPIFLKTILCICLVECLLGCLLIGMVRWSARNSRKRRGNKKVVAFYHPHCSGGGGGERVLWKMVQVLAESASQTAVDHVIIYTIEPHTSDYAATVQKHVQERFSLQLQPSQLQVSFVHLDDHAHLLQPAQRFSLLVESLGTMRLAFYALHLTLTACYEQSNDTKTTLLSVPDVWIDTTGAAFTYWPARLLFACQVLAYVHYPTISTDMLQRVWERRGGKQRQLQSNVRGNRRQDCYLGAWSFNDQTWEPQLPSICIGPKSYRPQGMHLNCVSDFVVLRATS